MGGIATVIPMHIYIIFFSSLFLVCVSFECGVKCSRVWYTEFSSTRVWQTTQTRIMPFTQNQKNTSVKTLQPFRNTPVKKTDERTKNEKAHIQFQMYFAVLRVLPQILLIFSAFILSGSLCFTVCLHFSCDSLMLSLSWSSLLLSLLLLVCHTIVVLYFESLVFGSPLHLLFRLINYEVYLLISFHAAWLCD